MLDRTKEPGSDGEPLYKDVVTCLAQAAAKGTFPAMPKVIGGRYGLSSKEFTPAMVKAVLDELKKDDPKNDFTVGINDDVTHLSLDIDPDFFLRHPDVTNAMFFGLGADGTVGANKNSIKIIGEETDFHAQGYFVYDSKKSGSRTISHLRFGPNPIHSPYLIQKASFIACHQYEFLFQTDMLRYASTGAVFLLNSPFSKEEVWNKLPKKVQAQDHRQEDQVLQHRRLHRRRRKPAWARASTPSCRPASSPSPASCPRTTPSRRSSIPSRRPTARRATTSSR